MQRMHRMSAVRVLATLLLTALPAAAQTPTPTLAPVPARSSDVATIDSIISALYASISGPAGQDRQWDRFRSLMAPGARLIPTGRRPDGTTSMTVQ